MERGEGGEGDGSEVRDGNVRERKKDLANPAPSLDLGELVLLHYDVLACLGVFDQEERL